MKRRLPHRRTAERGRHMNTGAERGRHMNTRAERGVMLLEVLITVLIFSIGLLGLVALQARASQYAMSAEDTNRAALLANEIASTMWGNQSPTLPADAYAAWQLRVSTPEVDGLPNGEGTVTTVGREATVTITWRPPSAAAGAPRNRFVTQVTIG